MSPLRQMSFSVGARPTGTTIADCVPIQEEEPARPSTTALVSALSPRSASGPFRSLGSLDPFKPLGPGGSIDRVDLFSLLGFLCLLGFLELHALVMLALKALHDLPQVLLRDQPLGLHVLEDFAPAFVALLLGRDLVKRQGLGGIRSRARALGLGLEEGLSNLLVPRRELSECSGASRLRPRVARHRRQCQQDANRHGQQNPYSFSHRLLPSHVVRAARATTHSPGRDRQSGRRRSMPPSFW